MKKILPACGAIGLLVIVGGVWLWLHLLAPPFREPLPNPSLSLVIEPQDGIAPVLSLINNATTSVDMVMYDLADTDVEKALVVARKRGVSVRVLLDKGYYGAQSPMNQPAYDYLENGDVAVRWTLASFALTHEKLLVIDGKDALIMGFNLTPAYYATSRDFAINDSDPNDVPAIEKVFDADWQDVPITAPDGDDLVWSPHAENELIGLIVHAKHSILVYNEEMSDRKVIQAFKDAAGRGVSVNIIMTYESSWKSAFFQLAASGVHLQIFPANAPIYVHAKMVVIDNSEAFVGSENFSASSLDSNRELGILITKPTVIDSLIATFSSDWTHK